MSLVPSFPVADVSRSVEFYRHVLGFELVGATGKGGMTRARLRLGEVEILFRSARIDDIRQAFRHHDAEDRLILHFKVADVSSFYERVKGRAAVVRDLETTLFGLGEFAVEDLDGIILSFSQAASQGASLRPVAKENVESGGLPPRP